MLSRLLHLMLVIIIIILDWEISDRTGTGTHTQLGYWAPPRKHSTLYRTHQRKVRLSNIRLVVGVYK